MSGLKPCPFCWSSQIVPQPAGALGWSWTCEDCYASGPPMDDAQEPRRWNTRADGWITDREPDAPGLYIATCAWPGDENYISLVERDNIGWKSSWVIAWMPLPVPYKQ